MLVNPNCGFASHHLRSCSASIKYDKDHHRTCEEPGATKHVALMSSNGASGQRIAHCGNVCVACAERLSKRPDHVIGDAVYREQWEVQV